MRSVTLVAGLGLLLTAGPASAQFEFRREAYRAHEEHWRSHPDNHEELVRSWQRHLFRREAPAPLLARWGEELRRGIAAPLALAHVLASPEYYVEVGSTPERFVRRTFVDIVGRPPSEAELRYWRGRLYVEDRSAVAYEMVTRYPPSWAVEAAPPVEYEYRPPIVHYRDRDRDRR
jgi:hypothetical protein